MGKYFSDSVETALDCIFYHDREGKGKQGYALLEAASAAGDADATAFLARCLSGYQYVWSGHGFPTDDKRAWELMERSAKQGSAIGVFLCLRSGILTEELEEKIPFASLREAYEAVLKKAQDGDPFCQYIIGNCYYWWDFIRIFKIKEEDFGEIGGFRDCIIENILKCEEWYEKAYRGGVYFAGNNLSLFYKNGEDGLIPPQPEKAKDLYRIGAEGGHPLHQYWWAQELKERGEHQEAIEWYRRAAEGGDIESWYELGEYYNHGKHVQSDIPYALSCYEECLRREDDHVGSLNHIGEIYFYGEGIPQDYEKAFWHLRRAYDLENFWGTDLLAQLYFNGWGVAQNYEETWKMLEHVSWESQECSYIRGYLCGRGLGGVKKDIARAVEHLEKAGDYLPAREERLRYKKRLFGGWTER